MRSIDYLKIYSFIATALLVSLALGWYSIAEVGNFVLRYGMVLSIFFIALSLLVRQAFPFKSSLLFFVPYALFLCWQVATAAVVVPGVGSVMLVAKPALYLILSFILIRAFLVGNTRSETYLGTAAIWGQFVFAVVFVGTFALQGENVLLTYTNDILRGDQQRLQHYYYRVLFQADVESSVSLRNGLIGAFFVYFALAAGTRFYGLVPQVFGFLCKCMALFFTFASVSRSNIVAIVLAFIVVLLIRLLQSPARKRIATNLAIGFGVVLILAMASHLLAKNGSPLQLLAERFGTQIFVENARLNMFQELFDSNFNVLTGAGLGSKVAFSGSEALIEHRTHNLILAGFYECGVVGLVLASLSYLGLILSWLLALLKGLRSERPWRGPISFGWTMALPCLPAFRCLVGGNGGQFTFVESVTIALFFSLVACNELPEDSELDNEDDESDEVELEDGDHYEEQADEEAELATGDLN